MPSYEELVQVNSELQRQVTELARLGELQRRHIEQQQRRIDQLEKLIEDLRRRGKRQAAPFSKGAPKDSPKPPGRKPGTAYGEQAVRAVPKTVDERLTVDCPLWCPDCQGRVRLTGKKSQYQIDLPEIRPRTTEFIVHYGQCEVCGKRVQGRHARQISDALDVGRVQLGPEAISLAAFLNKVGGLSYGKTVAVLREAAHLEVARSSLCRAVHRLAQTAAPTYQSLIGQVREAPVVYPDETGWRVGGQPAWLWAFTTPHETVYAIERGRGYAEAALILGEQYAGVIGADGWAAYGCFQHADHQTCLAHLLRRCGEMLETATRGAVRFPRAVKGVLQGALALRDRRDNDELSPHGLRVAQGRLVARLDRLLAAEFTNAANLRLANHLVNHREALFLFLQRPDVEATNWPAEQAIRPAVVNRKSCGGNRTWEGARTQAILTSLFQTCHQRRLQPLRTCSRLLQTPAIPVNELLPAAPPEPIRRTADSTLKTDWPTRPRSAH
jgi:transposase